MAKKAKKGPGKIAGKQIRKQVSSLKGDVKKANRGVVRQAKKAATKAASQNKEILSELSKLSTDMKNLKGKKETPKRELSMYNLFVRKQIEQGMSFEAAVKAWKSSKKVIENPELARAKTKVRTKTITKTVIKKVPKVVVRKVPVYTPGSVSTETKDSLNKIMREISSLKTDVHSLEKEAAPMPREKHVTSSPMNGSRDLPIEEVAVRLTKLYFEEIARLGFKRRLDFDAIINAYYYCLQRLQNKDKELEVMRKIVEREEHKLDHETKAQMFPVMNE